MLHLLQRVSFRQLVGTQFLTVFNDSVFKQTVLLLAVSGVDAQASGTQEPVVDWQALGGLIFAIPFLIFAVFAGDCADRFSKRSVLIKTKQAEIAVMLLSAAAFATGNFYFVLGILFLMGTQSAFLGPAKYGIVPELVKRKDLAQANGWMQGSVLVGIILGTGTAGFLKEGLQNSLWTEGIGLAILAVVGLRMARGIESVPAADPIRSLRLNPFAGLGAGLRAAAQYPPLVSVLVANSVFWLTGALVLLAWNEMGERILHVSQGIWSAALGMLTLSQAVGAMLAGRLSRDRLRIDLVAWGGLALSTALLAVALGPRNPWFVFSVLLAGNFFSSFYLIPLQTLIQDLPKENERGLLMGTNQMLNWIFIVAASGLKIALSASGFDATDTFYVISGFMMLMSVFLFKKLPSQYKLRKES